MRGFFIEIDRPQSRAHLCEHFEVVCKEQRNSDSLKLQVIWKRIFTYLWEELMLTIYPH